MSLTLKEVQRAIARKSAGNPRNLWRNTCLVLKDLLKDYNLALATHDCIKSFIQILSELFDFSINVN